ncbi:MAG: PepSY domain-containing protein, partial [Planctomycetota bacterium]
MPFVLLYGVTAILFNHPDLFGAGESSQIEASPFIADELTQSESVADAVLQAIAASSDSDVARGDRDARIVGDYVVDATTESSRVRYRFTADALLGLRRESPVAERVEAPLPERIEPPFADQMELFVQAVQGEARTERVRIRAAPDVEFEAVVEGESWIVRCDLNTGSLSATRAEDPRRPFDVRTFLLRLHVSHGYPLSMSARSVWAIVVDVTASLMIFWALSGIMMWWQMKPTRRSGAALMTAGLVLAGLLGFAMLRLLYY